MSRPSKALRRFLSCRTPGALRRLRDAGDEGFTLIELIVAVVILPLIIGAIVVALFVTFQDQVGVSTRVSTSADAQVTSAYFVRDVESAMYVTTTPMPSTGSAAWPPAAGATGACGSGTTLIVSLAWATGAHPIATTVTVVSYWRIASGMLERDLCAGTTLPSNSMTSRDFVSPFTHVLLSCSSAPCATAGTRWIPAASVSGLTLAVTEPLTKTEPLANTKGSPKGSYDYSLTAAPRATNSYGPYETGGPNPTTVPPLLALGAGLGVITENSSGTHKTLIHVETGAAVLNTGYFRMTKGTTFTAPEIDVKKTACSKSTYGLAHCTGTICASATTPPTCAPPTTPTAVWTHPAKTKTDPFATLTDPTPVSLGLPVWTTCQPHTGRLKPGEYECGGTPLTLTGAGTTVTLTRGIYIFDTGLQVNGNAKLKGTAVLLYLPCKHGTFDKWVPSTTKAATCSEGFGVSNGQVTVGPLRTGRYSNLWFWENVGDPTTASLHGKGAITVSTGVLYAPGAEVDLSGLGTQTTTAGAIVASTFRVANSHVTVKGFGSS